jgi:hypothetical protein
MIYANEGGRERAVPSRYRGYFGAQLRTRTRAVPKSVFVSIFKWSIFESLDWRVANQVLER